MISSSISDMTLTNLSLKRDGQSLVEQVLSKVKMVLHIQFVTDCSESTISFFNRLDFLNEQLGIVVDLSY